MLVSLMSIDLVKNFVDNSDGVQKTFTFRSINKVPYVNRFAKNR